MSTPASGAQAPLRCGGPTWPLVRLLCLNDCSKLSDAAAPLAASSSSDVARRPFAAAAHAHGESPAVVARVRHLSVCRISVMTGPRCAWGSCQAWQQCSRFRVTDFALPGHISSRPPWRKTLRRRSSRSTRMQRWRQMPRPRRCLDRLTRPSTLVPTPADLTGSHRTLSSRRSRPTSLTASTRRRSLPSCRAMDPIASSRPPRSGSSSCSPATCSTR